MRGYSRPLNYAIPYPAIRFSSGIRRYNHPFMQALATVAGAEWIGQAASTDVTVLTGANITNGHTITLVDGMGRSVTFEFRSSGSVTPGNVEVAFTGGDTADTVRDNFITAINNEDALPDPLRLTATTNGAGVVNLLADYNASRGNFVVGVGAFVGGLVAAQAASANRFTVDDATLVYGFEGPLAMPAALGMQRMIPTQTYRIPTEGTPNDLG